MKAHNIAANGGAANGVKKEAKDLDPPAPKKAKGRAAKKRKLQQVDEEETDVEEPVKEERVKGEFKDEDAIVKPECLHDCPPSAAPLHHLPSQSESTSTSSSSNLQTDNDDDDEVLFVSATEKQLTPDLRTHLSNHRHSHAPLPMSAISGLRSVDHPANMTFPQHLAAGPSPPPMEAMRMIASSNSFPYGYTPNTWVFPHESHSYL